MSYKNFLVLGFLLSAMFVAACSEQILDDEPALNNEPAFDPYLGPDTDLHAIILPDNRIKTEYRIFTQNTTSMLADYYVDDQGLISVVRKSYFITEPTFKDEEQKAIVIGKFDTEINAEGYFNKTILSLYERRGFTEQKVGSDFACFGYTYTSQNTHKIICRKDNVIITISAQGYYYVNWEDTHNLYQTQEKHIIDHLKSVAANKKRDENEQKIN